MENPAIVTISVSPTATAAVITMRSVGLQPLRQPHHRPHLHLPLARCARSRVASITAKKLATVTVSASPTETAAATMTRYAARSPHCLSKFESFQLKKVVLLMSREGPHRFLVRRLGAITAQLVRLLALATGCLSLRHLFHQRDRLSESSSSSILVGEACWKRGPFFDQSG